MHEGAHRRRWSARSGRSVYGVVRDYVEVSADDETSVFEAVNFLHQLNQEADLLFVRGIDRHNGISDVIHGTVHCEISAIGVNQGVMELESHCGFEGDEYAIFLVRARCLEDVGEIFVSAGGLRGKFKVCLLCTEDITMGIVGSFPQGGPLDRVV